MKVIIHKKSIQLICLFLLLVISANAQDKKANISKMKLNMAEYVISGMYVDSIDEPDLVEYAIQKMLDKLDPHSTYLSAEEAKKMNEMMRGNYQGVGLGFNILRDSVVISSIVPGGPSDKAGLTIGDYIIKIDSVSLLGDTLTQKGIVELLRGPKGSSVNLLVCRGEDKNNCEFIINREEIPVQSIEASYLITSKIGYIRLSRFAQTTYDEFKDALLKLKSEGMKDLILDLQGNGGGHFNSVIEIANDFLSSNELIVYAQGRVAKRQDYFAKESGLFRNGRLIVLVDESSASCSEVLSAAVQDWDRGVVIGRRTFGKGLIQRVVELPDKSQLRLTVSRYYTPSGRSIQRPYQTQSNDSVNAKMEYYSDFNKRVRNGEMIDSDNIQFDESLKVYTCKLKRPVYGGGGVMPDIFVPYDTTVNVSLMRKISEARIISKVSKIYMNEHKNKFDKAYSSFAKFDKSFQSNFILQTMLNKELAPIFKQYSQEDADRVKPLVETQLKAYLAYEKWGKEKFVQVMNKLNMSLEKALEVLNSSQYEQLLSLK